MNKAMLSSKAMNWCTPTDFFEKLDKELHFNLDPAATHKSAKCVNYFTPEENGLEQSWGGAECSAILHTVGKLLTGCARASRNLKRRAQWSPC